MPDTPASNTAAADTDQQQPVAAQQADSAEATAVSRTPLRWWPALVLVGLLWAFRIVGLAIDELSMAVMMVRFMAPLACGVLILLWWNFFSRAAVKEKATGTVGLIVVIAVTSLLADKTIRGFGTMIFAAPWGMTAFAVGLVAGDFQVRSRRMLVGVIAAAVGFGYWDLVRTDEIRGDFGSSHSWRWEPTAEERFLASLKARTNPTAAAEALTDDPLAKPEWPEFRGPERTGVQPGVILVEDWQQSPPNELWRIKIGPGWASFSVAGERLFTQEQRGENEVVSCYDANTGTELWIREDESRFWEAVGGAGPRATPTLSDDRLFALGANGLLNRLDPLTGKLVWQTDINKSARRSPPTWGYSSSPLVTHGSVIVHAGGPDDRGILAFDPTNGELKWSSPAGDHSYSSPQLSTVCGQTCVVTLTNTGVTLVNPEDGSLLGQHRWPYDGYRVVQPLVVDGSSILLGTAMGTGTRRIDLSWDGAQFAVEDAWTTRRMNPYYNDYVAHKGYLYGFDNNIFACVDLKTGERAWKRGRYGNGQVLLLPAADQLLVISERGELVLLRATPEEWTELARHPALDGRTWNHPVLVEDRLYVRNSEEAVCFEMSLRDLQTAENAD